MFKKSSTSEKAVKPGWKILIVDDEPDIHTVTKIALSRFEFDERGVSFLHAYSGEDAKTLLTEHDDIALVFLDVVMETDDAGLRIVRFIREELQNHFVRIVLRTGQPGQAPERDVIVNYDINDYKEKTTLCSDKLFTVTYSGLRGYRDIMAVEQSRKMLEHHREGLEKIIDSSASLFKSRSLHDFANGVLYQIASLLHIEEESVLVKSSNCTVQKVEEKFEVLAGTGALASSESEQPDIPEHIRRLLERACREKRSILEGDTFVGYFPSSHQDTNLIYVEKVGQVNALDKQLLAVFSNNIAIAFENLQLNKEIYETQAEIIETLGEVVENRSKEAANHVRRVSHLSSALALWAGLGEEDAQQLLMASPMHDVGKVAIPDAILLKPGKLDANEWEVMKTHVNIGHDIFARSKRPVLKAAAIVAGQHHEKYDGSGYPNGLKGEDIHIFGRIVALVDVFDALAHKRCYKEAWPLDEVLEVVNEQRGKHFDPKLVDVFIAHLDEVKQIMRAFPD